MASCSPITTLTTCSPTCATEKPPRCWSHHRTVCTRPCSIWRCAAPAFPLSTRLRNRTAWRAVSSWSSPHCDLQLFRHTKENDNMTLDTRTPQERAYDLQKSGEMYVKPEQTARLADYAASPESRALYATMSPEARH